MQRRISKHFVGFLEVRFAFQMLLYDNTAIEVSWFESETSDTEDNYKRCDRLINNVILAVPHPGVSIAAASKENKPES